MSDLSEIMRQLESLLPEDRARLEAEVIAATERLRFIPNPGKQTQAMLNPADVILYGGQAGGGKAQSLHSKVLTPFGFKAIGSLKLGDNISATDGSVQKVIGIYPQGLKDVYRIEMDDGGVTHACADHIWTGWLTDSYRKIKNVRTTGCSAMMNFTTEQMLKFVRDGADVNRRRKQNVMLPVTAPVAFNVAGSLMGVGNFVKRVIDPYLLGLILGDGHISKDGKNVSISSADNEIIDYLKLNYNVTVQKSPKSICCTVSFRGNDRVKLLADLKQLSLGGKGAKNKFIPKIYLHGSLDERFSLLQGLMDTDGSAEPYRGCYYSTISEKLRDDVIYLVRSLGGIASFTDRHPKYTHLGEKRTGQLAYTIRIKIPNPLDCFKLSRKKLIAETINHQSMGRKIKSITLHSNEECVCIRVSNPNSLYITDDFIVTHNSALGVGLAFNDHRRSLLLRRKYADLNGLIDQALVYNKGRNGFSSAPQPKLITDDGRLINFGACQHLGDEEAFQGQARDYYYFDELTQFMEQQFRYVIGWNRVGPGVDVNQRCRVMGGSNPPTSSDGDWVIGYWRPWLDPTYHKPAKSGELRWCVTDPDGKDMWVDGPELVEFNGKPVKPKSRTFISATLSDNPYLINTDYASTLDSLPEPMRSAMRDGNFMLSRADSDNQLIPTRWIQAAQARWVASYKQGKQMTALGVDVADGGGDDNVAAPWYDYFLDELKVVNGKDAPESSDVASFVVKHRRNGCPVGMDMGGGYGGAPKLILNDSGIDVTPFKGALGTEKLDRSGQLGFTNLISYAYWLFREALDPDQDGGSKVMLPMDQGLLSDLSAPTYETVHYKGKLCVRKESKDSIKKRIGRSPDKGDAVVIGYWLNVRRMKELQRNGGLGSRPIKVNLSHANKRRK